MDVEAFCRQSHLVVVVGKGGVGKTTVAATLADSAARAGLDVLIAGLDESGGIPTVFGVAEAPVGGETLLHTGAGMKGSSELVPGRIRSVVLTPDGALREYLDGHGLRRVSKRLVSSGALEVVATAIPGIREVLVLGKLRQLEQAHAAELIVLDAPASGHTYTFLTSSQGLVDTVRGGPLRSQAEQVVELLADPSRCQVLLVTIPEETPVNEAIETAYRIEDEVGVALGPIVVNGCLPHLGRLEEEPAAAARAAGVAEPGPETARRLEEAGSFRMHRQGLQDEELERLRAELPLEQLRLPLLFEPGIAAPGLAILSTALEAGIGEMAR